MPFDRPENPLYAVVDPSGVKRAFGHTADHAWNEFFGKHTYRPPTGEALRAYQSIGFRCVRYKLLVDPELPDPDAE